MKDTKRGRKKKFEQVLVYPKPMSLKRYLEPLCVEKLREGNLVQQICSPTYAPTPSPCPPLAAIPLLLPI